MLLIKNKGRIFNKEYENINEYLLNYFDEIGFSRTKQLLKGSLSTVYKNLWDRDSSNKITSEFRVKNPFDSKSDLTDSEKKFLIKLFLHQLK